MTEQKNPLEPDFFEISEVPPVVNTWDPKKTVKAIWLLEMQVAKLIEAARKQGNMMDMMAMKLVAAQKERDALAFSLSGYIEAAAARIPAKKTKKKAAAKGTKKNDNNTTIEGSDTAGAGTSRGDASTPNDNS